MPTTDFAALETFDAPALVSHVKQTPVIPTSLTRRRQVDEAATPKVPSVRLLPDGLHRPLLKDLAMSIGQTGMRVLTVSVVIAGMTSIMLVVRSLS